jgi:hypothetical protein
MSEDKLRDFIEDHTSEFDDLVPTEGLWDKIEDDLPKKARMVSLNSAMAVAASVTVLICASFWFALSGDEPQIAEVPVNESLQPIGLADLGGDMAEVEVYYVSEVNALLAELKDYEVDEEILEELDFLKDEFESLKSEMGQGAYRHAVLEAMIDNYRLRLEILESLLEELKEDRYDNNQEMA